MNILLLGKSGMLGSCFLDFFAGLNDVELFAFDANELDVTDYDGLSEKFRKIKPEVVINCAAYTAVDEAENAWCEAFKINSEAVKEIALLCKEIEAVLIHVSTDYVFDGEKADGYREDDDTNPINIYGESKAAGEKAIMESAGKYYIVRTSWLFGPNGKNFVDTMLKLGENALKKGTDLKVVNDQIGSPTYTNDLCEAVIKYFVQPLIGGEIIPDSGIYHLTNAGKCSWYDFAKKIFALKNMDLKVNPVSTGEFPRLAKRPANSVLLNTRLKGGLRNWEEALASYLE